MMLTVVDPATSPRAGGYVNALEVQDASCLLFVSGQILENYTRPSTGMGAHPLPASTRSPLTKGNHNRAGSPGTSRRRTVHH